MHLTCIKCAKKRSTYIKSRELRGRLCSDCAWLSKHPNYHRDWYQNNRETHLLHVNRWQRANAERYKLSGIQWRINNPEKIEQYKWEAISERTFQRIQENKF